MEYSSKGVAWIQKVESLKQMPELFAGFFCFKAPDLVAFLVGYGCLAFLWEQQYHEVDIPV